MLVVGCAILGEYFPRVHQQKEEGGGGGDGYQQRVGDVISVLGGLFVQASDSRGSKFFTRSWRR